MMIGLEIWLRSPWTSWVRCAFFLNNYYIWLNTCRLAAFFLCMCTLAPWFYFENVFIFIFCVFLSKFWCVVAHFRIVKDLKPSLGAVIDNVFDCFHFLSIWWSWDHFMMCDQRWLVPSVLGYLTEWLYIFIWWYCKGYVNFWEVTLESDWNRTF